GARESGIRRALSGEEPPGQRPMPARPDGPPPGARQPGQNTGHAPVPAPMPAPMPPPPPRRPDDDPVSMTAEMEAIGEEVQKRRSIDHTLARFSAVHDELRAEEREKKSKRRRLLPWQQTDDELDRLDELADGQTIAVPQSAAFDDEPSTRLKDKKARRRNKSMRAGRALAIVAAALVFLGTGVGWGVQAWINGSTTKVNALDPNSNAIKDADAQLGDENFLLVGSDTRAGAEAEEGVGNEDDIIGARSDTVMIAHVPKSRERVVVVSFPRDLEVNRPECERWNAKTGEYTGETAPSEEQVKLNTAYQVGGPMCVTKQIQEISGLAINHFVGIDFHGFKEMVDAVDGVQVCVESPMKDEVLGTIVPQAGKNVTLTGDQALNFVRARKVESDPTKSDYGRITRQQRFLSSLLRKAMSPEVLLDVGKLTGFVNAFAESTFGDNIDVETLMLLGQSMQGVDAGKVTFMTVPTVGYANDAGNEELRTEDTNDLFGAIRNDTPIPGESPAEKKDDKSKAAAPNAQLKSAQQHLLRQDQPAPVDPKTVKVQVLNGGNDQDGIAGDTADELSEFGYQIVWVDASPERVDRTVIKYSKVKLAQAQALAASVPDAQLVEDPAAGGALQLIIGPGFDGNVVAPGAEAPAPDLPDVSTVNAGDVSCV
ncbi:LCP family protein, partial [Actinophytocola xinjiangensis]|uniref:LCP family protein n=1 Tax=Actinophytocola xinjiangensis TaxID=485602 RepID=UPI000A6F3368